MPLLPGARRMAALRCASKGLRRSASPLSPSVRFSSNREPVVFHAFRVTIAKENRIAQEFTTKLRKNFSLDSVRRNARLRWKFNSAAGFRGFVSVAAKAVGKSGTFLYYFYNYYPFLLSSVLIVVVRYSCEKSWQVSKFDIIEEPSYQKHRRSDL